MTNYDSSRKQSTSVHARSKSRGVKNNNDQGDCDKNLSAPSYFHEPGWGNEKLRAYSTAAPTSDYRQLSSDVEVNKNKSVAKKSPQNAGLGELIQRAEMEKANPIETGVRGNLETHFGTSLDQVRVSQNNSSKQAADNIGAYAFTFGQTIHMGTAGSGLQGSQKNALLAHEVAHTLQQRGVAPGIQPQAFDKAPGNSRYESEANEAAREFVNSQKSGKFLRTSVRPTPLAIPMVQALDPTNWGEFEVARYESLYDTKLKNKENKPIERGVEMYLKFNPGKNVDAKKIGLVQTAKTVASGKIMKKGFMELFQTYDGVQIDFNLNDPNPNPMYQATDEIIAGKEGTLGGNKDAPYQELSAMDKAAIAKEKNLSGMTIYGAEWGENYVDELGNPHGPKPATLIDAPNQPVSYFSENSQEFETAALCVEGNPGDGKKPSQEGAYYGSIIWGWKIDSNNVFSKIDPKVISPGIPSPTFLEAANIWNYGKMGIKYISPNVDTFHYKLVGGHLVQLPDLVPAGTELDFSSGETFGGEYDLHYKVKIGNNYSYMKHNEVQKVATGSETIDLPIPRYSVIAGGNTMTLDDGSTILLEPETRLSRVSGTPGGKTVYQVADGINVGIRGTIDEKKIKSVF